MPDEESKLIPIYCENCERELTKISSKLLDLGEPVTVHCSVCGFETYLSRKNGRIIIEINNLF
ncbi:MAG: hypothetical protein LBQ61_02775 [Spirochaetales bacterium]|jgi:hypothetical protein|nr:hypothetical protein [Spirochaetales bacterium]